MVRVYYWKKEGTRDYLMGKVPDRAEFNKDYVQVWGTDQPQEKKGIALLENLYMRFNNYDSNPLSNAFGQKKLQHYGVGHTSMSVGDVVEIEGVEWLCLWNGWGKLRPLQEKMETALALHAANKDFGAKCRHRTTREGRCTRCYRRVVKRPRLTR